MFYSSLNGGYRNQMLNRKVCIMHMITQTTEKFGPVYLKSQFQVKSPTFN